MADIVDRLRLYAQQFEDQHAPEQITLAMRAGADEIERKKDEIASLLKLLADERTENMRLRAALREILGWHDYSNDMHKPIEVRAAYMRARAALEEK